MELMYSQTMWKIHPTSRIWTTFTFTMKLTAHAMIGGVLVTKHMKNGNRQILTPKGRQMEQTTMCTIMDINGSHWPSTTQRK